MTQTDRPPALSRRTFLTCAISLMGQVIAAGCHNADSHTSEVIPTTAPLPVAAPPPPVASVRINAVVPGRLVFPDDTTRNPLELVAIQTDQERTSITFQDSSGRRFMFPATASFDGGVLKRNGKADRGCLAPKVLASYVLDATRRTLIRQRTTLAFKKWGTARGEHLALSQELDALRQLRADFEKLQQQAVLGAVSVGALYAFLESVDGRLETLGRVRWDARERRLAASFV